MKKYYVSLATVIALTHNAWCMPTLFKEDRWGSFLARRLTEVSLESDPGFARPRGQYLQVFRLNPETGSPDPEQTSTFNFDSSGYGIVEFGEPTPFQDLEQQECRLRSVLSISEFRERNTLDSNLESIKSYNPDIQGSLLFLINPETGLPLPQTEAQKLRGEEALARFLLELSEAFNLHLLALEMGPPQLVPIDSFNENG